MSCDDNAASTVGEFYAARVNKEQNTNQNVCSLSQVLGEEATQALANIHEDLQKTSLGCGSPFPPQLHGCRVLDLGSGAGRDAYILSQLVGKEGSVVGVDMLDEMLSKARSYQQFHAERFGYANVSFYKGNLESLLECTDLNERSFDVVVSNCVVTLCANKKAVYSAVQKLLKPGGEFYWSDIYAQNTPTPGARKHTVAWNEGFGGALSCDEFVQVVRSCGFSGPFIASSRDYNPWDEQMKEVIGDNQYYARTVRLINLPDPKGGGSVSMQYNGGISGCECNFHFSLDTVFKKDAPVEVPRAVAEAVMASRYAPFFTVQC